MEVIQSITSWVYKGQDLASLGVGERLGEWELVENRVQQERPREQLVLVYMEL